MEEKTKLILWLSLCLVLLVGLVYLAYLWVDTVNILRQPCVVCAIRNSTFGDCIKEEQRINPFGVKINISEFLEKEEIEINKSTEFNYSSSTGVLIFNSSAIL